MRGMWRLLIPLRIYIRSITGTENIPDGPYLLAANHESPLDAGMLMLAVHKTVNFVATGRFQSWKDRLWLYYKLVVFGLGQSIPAGNGALERCRLVLSRGKAIGIFPEGEIHPKFKTGRIHTGAMVLAHQLQVPIVPVHITGAGTVWPIVGWVRPWKKRSITMVIGKPMQPPKSSAALTRQQYQSMSEALIWMIRDLR